jgi:hypothetical protein
MTNSPKTFGSPETFEVSLGWLDDDEPVRRRPKSHGWSMGELKINVAGASLTAHRVQGHPREGLVWYLGPLLHWLADNWVALFNEERFSWPEKSAGSAVEVCNRAIARLSNIDSAHDNLKVAEAWYKRHGIANAAAGGLFPDIFIRRFADDVEISWTAVPPPFAPRGFFSRRTPVSLEWR